MEAHRTHFLIDGDAEGEARRAATKPMPSAAVITVQKDGVKRHRRVETMREYETPETGFGEVLMPPHPTKCFEHRGRWCRIHRYSLRRGWSEAVCRP